MITTKKPEYYVTLKQLRKAGACVEGYNKVVCMLKGIEFDDTKETHMRFAYKDKISLIEIAKNNGLDDALWCLRVVNDCDRDARLFAVWCVRQVQHIMQDQRSIDALDSAEKYANGEIDEESMDAACDAACDAAWAAACDAACDAAWAAACDAVWAAALAAAGDAARAAAWSAAGDAARAAAWSAAGDAARAAAWAAEIEKQLEMFIKMCNGEAHWQKV